MTMFWATLITLFAGAFAQDPQVPDPGIVIRSTTSLVQVRVVVDDSRGKPVAGLKREDFQVQDDRKTQPITLFAADGSPAPLPGSAASSEPPAQVQRAGEYSLILLDWLNTNYADRLRSQQHLLDLLKTYQPRQKVAVYLLGRRPRLIKEFTNDMAEVAQAIVDAGLDPEDMGPDAPAGRFDARFGAKAGPRPSVEEQLFFLNNRINDSFHSFELVADRLAHIPGRKSLIWLTAAFPLLVNGSVIPGASAAETTYYSNVERLLARLNRSDVAVYPIDARGLVVFGKGYPATMEQISERTGGFTFTARNDIDEGFRLALEDMRVSYVLGFHVPAGAAPGLHEIRVRVNRPAVRLRYRESYQLADASPVR